MRLHVTAGQSQKHIGVVVIGCDNHSLGVVKARAHEGVPNRRVTINRDMFGAGGVFLPVNQDEGHRLMLQEAGSSTADPTMAEDKNQILLLFTRQKLQSLKLFAGSGEHHQRIIVKDRFPCGNRKRPSFPDTDNRQPCPLTDLCVLQRLPGKGCAMDGELCDFEITERIKDMGQGTAGR